MIAVYYLRTVLFYVLFYAPFTIIWSTVFMIFGMLIPTRYRALVVVGGWSKATTFATKWILGINYKVTGWENVPKDRAFVVVANHQSAWETFFLFNITPFQTQVIKKSLLKIPFFGWAYSLMKPIAIDRADRKGAMKQLITIGTDRLKDGFSIVIYPEGTRTEPGNARNFSRGGFAVAANAEVEVLPVAHNSGSFWLNHRFLKVPGTVEVVIHPPLMMNNDNMKENLKLAQAQVHASLNDMESRSITPALQALLPQASSAVEVSE